MKRFFLDHAATTPLRPEVRAAMLPWLGPSGNPSSLHTEGRAARRAVDDARVRLASAFGCEFGEVVFTSSGTEAANLAILGLALQHLGGPRRRILLGAAEHHCVLHCGPILQRLGYEVEWVPVDALARVGSSDVVCRLGDDVLLLSVMSANNELGTFNPIDEFAGVARDQGVLLHCDAVQTFSRAALPPADLISVSAHKLGGPTGVGALYVRAGVLLQPMAVGGGQEREVRAGTENVAGIVGFGEAVRLAVEDSGWTGRTARARDAFSQIVCQAGFLPTVPSGDPRVLPSHLHGRFAGASAETMLIALDRAGVSASSGAACSSGSIEPSHVLLACGWSEQEAREGLRFTFGGEQAEREAAEAARIVLQVRDAVAGGA